MLYHPEQLVMAAKTASMKCPPTPECFLPWEYPHFWVFCRSQLGREMKGENIFANAEIIARIPDAKITKVTHEELHEMGAYPEPFDVTPKAFPEVHHQPPVRLSLIRSLLQRIFK